MDYELEWREAKLIFKKLIPEICRVIRLEDAFSLAYLHLLVGMDEEHGKSAGKVPNKLIWDATK